MSDIKLFSLYDDNIRELSGKSMVIERTLQRLLENNLETILGIKFLGSEYTTGHKHRGRIDTIGIDENNLPVIVEYKRATNENIINQGLFYLDWLLDHKAEFELLVLKKYGKELSNEIDWSNPRLVCIAGGFTKYDEHSVQLIDRNIELYRYKLYEDNYLLLDLVNATTSSGSTSEKVSTSNKNKPKISQKTMSEQLTLLDENLKDLYLSIHDYIMSLGDEVQFKELKFYGAFKRIKNFVCIEVLNTKRVIVLYVKGDPSEIEMIPGFTRDVKNIGHYGTGDIEITIRSEEEFEKAKPLINMSYENN